MARAYTNGSVTAFDAHCHLDHLAPESLRTIIDNARQRGVDGWMLAGADPQAWPGLMSASRIEGCFYQLGIHPWWAQGMSDDIQDHWMGLLHAATHPNGIGESGLDKARAKTRGQRTQQLRAFRAHIHLALQRQVPLVLHGTGCWGSVLAELPPSLEAMLHSFSGSPETARTALKRGMYLSFGPSVLTSARAKAACLEVPDQQLLIETDSPDQAAPSALMDIAQALAELRGVPLEHLLKITRDNAHALFRIPELSNDS